MTLYYKDWQISDAGLQGERRRSHSYRPATDELCIGARLGDSVFCYLQWDCSRLSAHLLSPRYLCGKVVTNRVHPGSSNSPSVVPSCTEKQGSLAWTHASIPLCQQERLTPQHLWNPALWTLLGPHLSVCPSFHPVCSVFCVSSILASPTAFYTWPTNPYVTWPPLSSPASFYATFCSCSTRTVSWVLSHPPTLLSS